MAIEPALEREVAELERKLASRLDGRPPFTLTPAWWQERLLQWATTDPDFRVKLLRFVDVLPTLRSARSVADHVRQYFRGAQPGLIGAASGLAAEPIFRPVLSQVVRQGVFSMARRFIAGRNAEEALPALRELARESVGYTVDLLGEETLSDAEAEAYLARYSELIETLSAHAPDTAPGPEGVWEGVPPVNISIKLSALCAHFEPAAPEYVSEVTRRRLRPLLRLARERGAFINFDMEQFRYKDLVHAAFKDIVSEDEFRGYPHFGVVVQAYLRDALDDVRRLRLLAERRGAPLTVRLVKGAYWDEERIVADQNSWPVPVWERKEDTDRNFEDCTGALLEAWPHLRTAIGSHNPRSVAQAAVRAKARGLSQAEIEFQVLYGMAEELREAIAGHGYRTRVYVPVGEVIPGMAYLVRRLLENTSNQAWFNAGTAPRARPDAVERGPAPARAAAAPENAIRNAPPAQFFDPGTRRMMQEALAHVRRGFGAQYPLLIGRERVSGRPLAEVRCPAEPGAVIARVAQATRDDADEAVRAAREAFPAWRDLPASERGDILRRAADILAERRFQLAATMVYECAKPWHEADGDVAEAVDYLRYYAAQGEALAEPRLMQEILGEDNRYFHEGRGVTAVIAPWNFPLAIICGMSAGALAGGNCAILKPAAQSPVIAYKLVQALREAGVPDGVVQFLPGPGSEIGQALTEHPGVDNIAFTGSSAVGLAIIEAASRAHAPTHAHESAAPEMHPGGHPGQGRGPAEPHRPNVKRVIAEMGGKNAIIIDDDADLDQAIHGTVVSAFGYAGQKCSACSRLIIVGHAYEEALERLKNAVASLVAGPAGDPAAFVPPVISRGAQETILRYIESGRESSTLLVQTGISHLRAAPGGGGYYVAPAVFVDVPRNADIARDEIFGPVLSVFHARDFEEALEIALDSDFALTGGVYSRNPRHIEMARSRFRVGNLYVNRKTTGAVAGRHPFGGLRMSGIGEKAGGPDYVRQFMDPRTVSENTARRGFAPEEWL
jgi:RHH-type proline utilization regulon transcriptional repressor/proline dehydrogenase/delta 1-pyrroline-5-carboxylate dehydrogenase